MKSFSRFLPFTLLALAACSGNDVSSTLGMTKEAPDEFVVVSRPPLVVPPEFDLQPPRPGEEPPHAETTEQQARKLLLGGPAKDDVSAGEGEATSSLQQTGFSGGSNDAPSLDEFMNQSADDPKVDTAVDPVVVGEAPTAASASFLKNAGADVADDTIRQQLRTAKPAAPVEADSLYEEIVGGKQQEPVVDSSAEAERLRSNKDEGKPVTEGETPTKDETSKSVIDSVF